MVCAAFDPLRQTGRATTSSRSAHERAAIGRINDGSTAAACMFVTGTATGGSGRRGGRATDDAPGLQRSIRIARMKSA